MMLKTATVVSNKDPRGVGCVQFRIPDFIEPKSAWALPMGTLGGGSYQRGAFFIPEVGADILVAFIDGDDTRPVYWSAHWGIVDRTVIGGTENDSEVPTRVADVDTDERAKVKAIETEKFTIYIDDRAGSIDDRESGKERLLIEYKDDPEVRIELDGINKAIGISASSGVEITSSGLVSISGSQVQIQGRVVNQVTSKEI
jgi:uncharacterized protein involved in type VI secretion and phage assembly